MLRTLSLPTICPLIVQRNAVELCKGAQIILFRVNISSIHLEHVAHRILLEMCTDGPFFYFASRPCVCVCVCLAVSYVIANKCMVRYRNLTAFVADATYNLAFD